MSQAAIELRPATIDDIDTVVAIDAAFRPDEPLDPVVQHYEWETPEPGTITERWIAEVDGRPVGYGMHFHPDWETMTEKNCIIAGGPGNHSWHRVLWPSTPTDGAYQEIDAPHQWSSPPDTSRMC